MPADKGEVKITIRLDDVVAPVYVGLKYSLQLVGELLSRAPAAVGIPESSQNVFFDFDPAPALKPSQGELRTYVDQRILHWAVSDSVELINPLIVTARAVCSMYDRGPSYSMTGDEWNAILEESKLADERMSKLDRPSRIRELLKRHPDLKMPPLLPEIEGIFRMRNCLVHNNGIVGPSYSNERGGLRIRFWRYSAWVVEPTGEHEYTKGEIIREPQRVQIRFDPAERLWAIGERIVLSHQLFVDLCVTIARFALQMAKALEAYARSKGIPFESDPAGDRPVAQGGSVTDSKG